MELFNTPKAILIFMSFTDNTIFATTSNGDQSEMAMRYLLASCFVEQE